MKMKVMMMMILVRAGPKVPRGEDDGRCVKVDQVDRAWTHSNLCRHLRVRWSSWLIGLLAMRMMKAMILVIGDHINLCWHPMFQNWNKMFWNLIHWNQPLINMFFGGGEVVGAVDHYARNIFNLVTMNFEFQNNRKTNLWRLQKTLGFFWRISKWISGGFPNKKL